MGMEEVPLVEEVSMIPRLVMGAKIIQSHHNLDPNPSPPIGSGHNYIVLYYSIIIIRMRHVTSCYQRQMLILIVGIFVIYIKVLKYLNFHINHNIQQKGICNYII
jgi:hypothetical protein